MTNNHNRDKPLVTIETKTELLISLPRIKTEYEKKKLQKFIETVSEADEKFQRVVNYSPHLLVHLDDTVILRMATPRELGCRQDLSFDFWVDDVAKRNNLKQCHDSDAIRLASVLSEIKPSLPHAFLELSWRVHMYPMDFRMSGDMFISGFGCPDPVFEINPHYLKVLSVKWIYRGQNRYTYLDDPIVFRKSP